MDAACSVDGCPNRAQRSGLCWAHVKQRQRRGQTAELQEPKGAARDRAGIPRRSSMAQLEDAALDYADADASGQQGDFDRAKQRLLVAATRVGRHPRLPQDFPAPRGRPATGVSRWAAWRRKRRSL